MNREEAIKIIKSATVYTPEEMEALETLIPELRESEDERIRKELWEYFHELELSSDRDFSPSFTIDDILAWLEKQKEQKVDIDKLRKDIYQSGYNDGYQHGKEDAQKEPKPAEWSEEDEEMCQNILECLRNGWRKLHPDVLKYESWLRSLCPDSYKNCNSRWKPSEEQMAALAAAKMGVDTDYELLESLYEQLKAL